MHIQESGLNFLRGKSHNSQAKRIDVLYAVPWSTSRKLIHMQNVLISKLQCAVSVAGNCVGTC